MFFLGFVVGYVIIGLFLGCAGFFVLSSAIPVAAGIVIGILEVIIIAAIVIGVIVALFLIMCLISFVAEHCGKIAAFILMIFIIASAGGITYAVAYPKIQEQALEKKRNEKIASLPENHFSCTLVNYTDYDIKEIWLYSYKTKEKILYAENPFSDKQNKLELTAENGEYNIEVVYYDPESGSNKKITNTQYRLNLNSIGYISIVNSEVRTYEEHLIGKSKKK